MGKLIGNTVRKYNIKMDLKYLCERKLSLRIAKIGEPLQKRQAIVINFSLNFHIAELRAKTRLSHKMDKIFNIIKFIFSNE